MEEKYLKKVIMTFLFKELSHSGELNETVSLIELGLDSIKVIQLVVYLETELNITFDDEDLLLANFKTIELIIKTTAKTLAKTTGESPEGVISK